VSSERTTSRTLRVAIIGCGKIADQHVQVIRRIPDCTIAGLCDRELLMAKQLAERFEINAFSSDLREMLATTSPDVIHLTTPPQSHYALARECLEAGKHVYLEKPFTVTAEEAESLIQLADRKNVKITAGHNLQFTFEMVEMRRLVTEGFLGGKPVHLESHFSYDLGDRSYVGALLGNRQHWVRQLPGQLLHNIISHGIARLTEFLDDEIIEIIAMAGQSPRLQGLGENEILDELRVMIRDKMGTTAFFSFSTEIKGLNQLHIYGPAGSLTADVITGSLIRNTNRPYKSYLTYFIPPLKNAREHLGNARCNVIRFLGRRLYQDFGMKELIERFYRSIRKGGPLPIPYREIILTARIMDEIFAQIYPGRKTNGGGRTAESRRQMADDARQPPTSRLARDKEDGRQIWTTSDQSSIISHLSSAQR
jgi:predicted dehydrogenase